MRLRRDFSVQNARNIGRLYEGESLCWQRRIARRAIGGTLTTCADSSGWKLDMQMRYHGFIFVRPARSTAKLSAAFARSRRGPRCFPGGDGKVNALDEFTPDFIQSLFDSLCRERAIYLALLTEYRRVKREVEFRGKMVAAISEAIEKEKGIKQWLLKP